MNEKFSEIRFAARAAALRGCSMFADLSPEDLKQIASFVEVRQAQRGNYLYREGELVRGFYIVRRGAVSVHRLGADGTEKVIHIFREGQSFAEGALAGVGGYPASARVVEDSQHLRLLVNALEDLQGKDVETRLIHWLLKRCPTPRRAEPLEISLDVTKSVLAAELGTRNETLSRALAKLRDAGHIAVDGKRISVLSPLRLEAQFRSNLGEPA